MATRKNPFVKHNLLDCEPFEYKKVSKLLAAKEIDFIKKKANQVETMDHYLSAVNKVRDKTKPIFCNHGLQNFSTVKLGDNRIWYDQSFYSDTFNPEIKERFSVDHGLSNAQVIANRKRDYEYALKHVTIKEVEGMEAAMRTKLKQRTTTGPFQLRKTFKYFDRDGSGGISIQEMLFALEILGFPFSPEQVTALFAHYDKELDGDLSYKDFIERLMEQDFVATVHTWLLPKKKQQTENQKIDTNESHYSDEIQESQEFEKEAVYELFQQVDKESKGEINSYQAILLLLMTGSPYDREVLEATVDRMLEGGSGRGGIDFQAFWRVKTQT